MPVSKKYEKGFRKMWTLRDTLVAPIVQTEVEGFRFGNYYIDEIKFLRKHLKKLIKEAEEARDAAV